MRPNDDYDDPVLVEKEPPICPFCEGQGVLHCGHVPVGYERGLRAALEAVSYKGLLRGGKLWCDIDPDGLLRPEDVRTMCYDAIERLLEEAGKGRGGDG